MDPQLMIIMLLYIIAVILGFAFFPTVTTGFFIGWFVYDIVKWIGKKSSKDQTQ